MKRFQHLAVLALFGASYLPGVCLEAQEATVARVTPEACQQVSDAVAGYLEKDFSVGAELLIRQGGETLLHKVYGMADLTEEKPWEEGTICNIRSMSKPITGLAAQLLIDRGELSLDDPVAKYIPGFDTDRAREITLRQLLTHQSGLPLTVVSTGVSQYESLQALANEAGKRGPQHPPGSKFWYSDAGSDTVGAIVEKVTGQSLDQFVTKEIFEPLGMADTFYGIDANDPRFSRISSLHLGRPKHWIRFWTPADGKAFYPFAWGSQTIYSTPADYAKFVELIMHRGRLGDRQFVSEEAIDRILTPAVPMSMLGSDAPFPCSFRGLTAWYGQLMVVYRGEESREGELPVAFGHSGSDGTGAWAWPARDLVVMYFTQSRGGPSVLRLEQEIDRWLLHGGQEVVGEPAPEHLQPYVGRYVANFARFDNEIFEVRARQGKLVLDVPSQMVFELMDPTEEGRWCFAIAPQQIAVTFDRDDDDQVIGLRMHQGTEVFEVPREGTARAEEMSKVREVPAEVLESLVGTYWDAESEADVELVLNQGVLTARVPPGLELALRPGREEGVWVVRENPAMSVTFERDDAGTVISMTRRVGEETRVMKRK